MSNWTKIHGTIVVRPLGRTQIEKRYVLETVLNHLPKVSGSECDMETYVVQKRGANCSSSHTEFGVWGGHYSWREPSLDTQEEYVLVVDGSLRDKVFNETYREFQNWLCRLAKRAHVEDVLVKVEGQGKVALVRNQPTEGGKWFDTVYGQMFEPLSWNSDNETGEPNWCEYLMWERAKGFSLPMMLEYKYYRNSKNDAEVERRRRYQESDDVLVVSDIVWDAPKDARLPKNLAIEDPNDELLESVDAVVEFLTEKFGYCVKSLSTEEK